MIYSRIDLQTHAGSALDNPVTLTSDLLTSRSMHACHWPDMEYMSKDFVADSSGRIMFRTRTERQTDKQTKFQYDW